MTFKTIGMVGLTFSLALVTAYPAVAKHVHHHSAPPPYAEYGPSYGPSYGPQMIEVRPGLWISSWDCVTDEGQGRWKPCSTGRW
jgi:hypothetical protein